jgi:anti-sigma factor RsiW
MTDNLHARARQLMLDGATGALATGDSVWLTRHLAECAECRKEHDELISTVAMLRSATVSAPPFLAARTRAQVRSHAAELQKTREKKMMVLLALCFDVVWTTLIVGMAMTSASWLGYSGGMGWLVIGVLSWLWLVPAIGIMVLVSLRKSGLAPNLATWRGLTLEGDARD